MLKYSHQDSEQSSSLPITSRKVCSDKDSKDQEGNPDIELFGVPNIPSRPTNTHTNEGGPAALPAPRIG